MRPNRIFVRELLRGGGTKGKFNLYDVAAELKYSDVYSVEYAAYMANIKESALYELLCVDVDRMMARARMFMYKNTRFGLGYMVGYNKLSYVDKVSLDTDIKYYNTLSSISSIIAEFVEDLNWAENVSEQSKILEDYLSVFSSIKMNVSPVYIKSELTSAYAMVTRISKYTYTITHVNNTVIIFHVCVSDAEGNVVEKARSLFESEYNIWGSWLVCRDTSANAYVDVLVTRRV
jgi:hypothetical protein